jgi:hypothetical protein
MTQGVPVGAVEAGEQPRLVLRVPVEVVDAGAREFFRVEAGQLLADVILGRAEHVLHRLVHVDDAPVGVGHHDVGGDVVQGDPDAQVLVGDAFRLGHVEAQPDLHVGQGFQNPADFVVSVHLDGAVVAALGNLVEVVDGPPQRLHDGARQQPAHARRAEDRGQKHGQHQAASCGGLGFGQLAGFPRVPVQGDEQVVGRLIGRLVERVDVVDQHIADLVMHAGLQGGFGRQDALPAESGAGGMKPFQRGFHLAGGGDIGIERDLDQLAPGIIDALAVFADGIEVGLDAVVMQPGQ